MADEKNDTKTESDPKATTTPATPQTKAAAASAVKAAPAAPKADEYTEVLAAPEVFKLEKRNKAHVTADQAKALPPRKIEVTHGRIVCGTAVRDKVTRGRLSEDVALVGDRLTVPGDEALRLVRSGVAKFADLPEQPA